MIVLEFNELCSELIHEFMGRGLLRGFRTLYERSTVFTTEAGENPPNLEPWIQWPSVHSGMTYEQHEIYNLGDGHRLREKCVAKLLSDAGIPVGVFGSMNVNYRELNGYFIPDPWHRQGRASPKWLQPYYQIIAKQVQESSKAEAFTKTDMARLGWFMPQNGLTIGTVKTAVRQLLDERRDPGVHWRRASLLDDLQYDLFRSLNKRYGVRFATFFSNSTAHYQHYYWRNMQPERFEMGPSPEEHESLGSAILYGYQSMDRLIRRALIDYPDATIVLCTALSQRAWTETTKCTFRPLQFESLFAFAGIRIGSVTVKPVMAEQFHLEFGSIDTCERGEHALRDLYLDGRPLMAVRREDQRSLFCGCDITDARLIDRQIVRRSNNATKPFKELFYMIHSMRSGWHDPSGLFWLGNGHHQVMPGTISIVDIAPTILAMFDVGKPPYMHGNAVSARTTAAVPVAVV